MTHLLQVHLAGVGGARHCRKENPLSTAFAMLSVHCYAINTSTCFVTETRSLYSDLMMTQLLK
jgi:hypothetical protein